MTTRGNHFTCEYNNPPPVLTLVNVYHVDSNGAETLQARNVHLADCFDDADARADADYELKRFGESWHGGGAAPLTVLRSA